MQFHAAGCAFNQVHGARAPHGTPVDRMARAAA